MSPEPDDPDHPIGPDGGTSLRARPRATAQVPGLTHLLLHEQPRYTQHEVAELAGVDLGQAIDLWRALGFATPESADAMFTDADVEALQIAVGLRDSGIRLQLPLARALGQSMARMTEWQADLLRQLSAGDQPVTEDRAPASTDREVATRFAVLLPTWERLQQHVWRRHLLAAIERQLGQPASAGELVTVIGFADISEYTSTSRGLTASRLEEFIENFAADSSLTVTDRGGRVIKTIGDEIMFAVDDPRAGADIALALARRPSELDGRPELHVGLAYGPVLRHLGDYYGTVVNLASRLTSLARPGTVLIDEQMAGAVSEDPRWSTRALRSLELRGFPRLQPWLLRDVTAGSGPVFVEKPF